jgi:hypothetical protein
MLKDVWVEETFIVKPEQETPPAVAENPPALPGTAAIAAAPTDRPPSRPETAGRPPSRPDSGRPASSRPEPVPRPASHHEVHPRPPSKPEAVPAAVVDQQAETRLAPAPAAIRATPRSASVLPAPTSPRPATKPRPTTPEDVAQLTAKLLRPPRRPGELGWIGNFRVLEFLGGGSTALVFRAEEIALHTPVALKIMKPAENDDGESRQRFVREGKAAAGLEHDHIATVYQVSEDRGIPFIVMRLLHGETLAQRLRTQPTLPIDVLLRIGREIALGLTAAHEKGLVHRDIKPPNIWLESPGDRVKILDFGLAEPTADAKSSRTGAIVGTPAYMSPEQARGAAADPRSDLYNLGCVLYRMAAGRPPLVADDPPALLRAVAREEPPLLLEFRPDAPPELAHLVARLLAKSPDDRPGSAAETAEALAKIVPDDGTRDPHGFLPARPWGGSFWGKLGLRSALAATVLFAVYFLFVRYTSQR